MPMYQRIFVVQDVAELHKLFLDVAREAEAADRARARAGLPPIAAATRAEVLRAYRAFSDRLDDLARHTAVDATKKIQLRLKATAKRPDTGLRPHLRNGIVSRPLPFGGIATGAVGVADETSLNKVVNPTSPGYGPYWRAQEFGTGSPEVKSQKGRVLRGYFFDTGLTNPTVPQKNRSDQPIFVSGRAGGLPGSAAGGIGPKGGKGGRGVIGREIEGRHFIRDGADQARVTWRTGVRAVERLALRDLQAVVRTPSRNARRRKAMGVTRRRRI